HGTRSAGVFRSHKRNHYEGGIRESRSVWGPGLVEKSAVGTTNSETIIAGVDYLPSVLTIAGQKPPQAELLDGQDLSQSLLGKERAHRTKPLFWLRPPDRPGPAQNPFPALAGRHGN